MHLACFCCLENGVEFVLFSNSIDELHERSNLIAKALDTDVLLFTTYSSFCDLDSEVTFKLSNLHCDYHLCKDFFSNNKLPFEE